MTINKTKGAFSYFDWVRESSHPDNDFVWLLDVQPKVGGTITQGDYKSIGNTVANDKLKFEDGGLDIVLSHYKDFDKKYPDLRRLRVIGFCGHNLPPTTVITATWERVDGLGVFIDSKVKTLVLDDDYYLRRNFQVNDWFVFDDPCDWVSGVVNKVKISITPPLVGGITNRFEIGRVWMGSLFSQDTQISGESLFDGGTRITYLSNGELQRNEENSAGYPKAAPVQRMISVTKSNMPFQVAHGLHDDATLNYENMYTESYAKMAMECHRFRDVVVMPDYANKKAMKFTTVWGSIQNNMTIAKSPENDLYSCSVDVLELVDEGKN